MKSAAIVNPEIISFLQQEGNLSWQALRSLPDWFKIDDDPAINELTAEHILALLKARNEHFIKLKLNINPDQLFKECKVLWPDRAFTEKDALLSFWTENKPIIERALWHQLKINAESNYIKVLGDTLPGLQRMPVNEAERLLIIDPGSRSGIKLLITDNTGEELSHSIIFPHEPQNQWQQGLRKFGQFVQTNRVTKFLMLEGEGFPESRRFMMAWLKQQDMHYPVYQMHDSVLSVLCDRYNDDNQDNLHNRARQAAKLAINTYSCFHSIPLQCLLNNALKTVVNPLQLEQYLRTIWEKRMTEVSEACADPRYANAISEMTDLKTGLELIGQVINITDFGYFMDVGIEQNGLLHRSQLPKGQSYQINDSFKVYIEKINQDKQQFSLSTNKPVPKRSIKKPKHSPQSNSAMADALKAALSKKP